MLWRLPAPVRSFVLAPAHSYSVTSHAKPTPGPLRILFCGSDEFSIASLRVLDAARRGLPGLIDSIHVVHRPPKRTGRGLKILKEGMLPCYEPHDR